MAPEVRHDDDATTLFQARFRPNRPTSSPFRLSVVTGASQGQELVLDGCQPRLLIGAGPACDLRLQDRTVSRRHATLDVRGDALHLVDQGSRNGTRVNGVIVIEAVLVGGERVQLGDTELTVSRDATGGSTRLTTVTRFGQLLGASLEMRRLYPLCERLAAADIPVVIEGETGTGKEALAESLHMMGPRASGPFVVFDCTAVPPNLLESELFGHERGAFTGATSSRRGVFERAHGGTLFIDEIGELDVALQAKLLRAIERSEVHPLGSDTTLRVDTRVLAATRRDLDREVQAGRFRDDLFHRLAVGRIELPPLRERRGDVGVLAAHFAERMSAPAGAIPSEVAARWDDYPWPGNVRELRNAVARYLALGELGQLAMDAVRQVDEADANVVETILELDLPLSEARDAMVQAFERRYIERALSRSGGNVTHAARASGVGRRYFQTLKSRLGADK
ncbi:MAG: sigma 54-interacting transcriptional regulator [Polyangiaceae bacterium]